MIRLIENRIPLLWNRKAGELVFDTVEGVGAPVIDPAFIEFEPCHVLTSIVTLRFL